jgi:hypothetical protein
MHFRMEERSVRFPIPFQTFDVAVFETDKGRLLLRSRLRIPDAVQHRDHLQKHLGRSSRIYTVISVPVYDERQSVRLRQGSSVAKAGQLLRQKE